MRRLREWRAPRWMPLFIRRRFTGVWTQAEIDEIKRRGHERWLRMRHLFDDDDEE